MAKKKFLGPDADRWKPYLGPDDMNVVKCADANQGYQGLTARATHTRAKKLVEAAIEKADADEERAQADLPPLPDDDDPNAGGEE